MRSSVWRAGSSTAHRPVGDRCDVAAVLIEHRKQPVQRDIGAAATTPAATLIGRVGHDSIEPRAECGVSAKRIDLPDHGQEGVLHPFLGVLCAPRDPHGEAPGAVTVGGHQILAGRRITPAEGRHERAVPVDPCRHARVASFLCVTDHLAGPWRRVTGTGQWRSPSPRSVAVDECGRPRT